MRNIIPTIAESEENIQQRIGATKSKRSKQRLQALFLIKSGECLTRDSVAKSLGVHRHTVSRWLAKYEQGGLDELLEIRTRPNRKRVVPDTVYRSLEAVLRESPEQFSSYRDVQAWLRENFDLDVKYKTLYRLIRYEMKVDLAKADTSVRSGSIKKTSVSKVTLKTAEEATAVSSNEAPETVATPNEANVRKPKFPDFERHSPTVANFFRSVAFLLEDESIEPVDVIQAVRAAHAILNASPPFGYFDEEGQSYLPVSGRRMQHRRHEARRELRRLQSSVNKSGVSPEQTRTVLNRLADQFDAISHGTHEAAELSVVDESTISRLVTGSQNAAMTEPSEIFLDDSYTDQFDVKEIDTDSDPSAVVGQADYIVLFAEEDDITASIVKRQLSKKAASVMRIKSSKEVFEALAKYPVDLMVINTKLADEDGLDLLRKLRDEPAFDNIPIVAVGWPEDVKDASEVLRYGADEYISKPFSPNEFTGTIVKLLIASRTAVQKRNDRAPVKIVRGQSAKLKEDESRDSDI